MSNKRMVAVGFLLAGLVHAVIFLIMAVARPSPQRPSHSVARRTPPARVSRMAPMQRSDGGKGAWPRDEPVGDATDVLPNTWSQTNRPSPRRDVAPSVDESRSEQRNTAAPRQPPDGGVPHRPPLASARWQQAQRHNYRGRLLADGGNYDEAIQEFSLAINLVSDDAMLYSNRGYARLHHGDLDQALQDLNEAIRLDPELDLAYGNRAQVYQRLGQTQQARDDAAAEKRLQAKSP